MPAPPLRAAVSGSPTRATANTGFGALWDYVTGLLGASGNAADARKALGLPDAGPVSGFRNLLINGNFAINQRGYVSGTATSGANQYTLDRWRVVTSGQNVAFSASGSGNQVTAPAGGLEQVIEGENIAGGTYVLNWGGTATATVNGTSRAKGASFSLTAGSNATVRFTGGTVTEAQLEPGSQPTTFEQRNIAVELQMCLRYYEAVPVVGFNYASSAGAGWQILMYPYKVVKRVNPTVSFGTPSYSNCSAVVSTATSSAHAVNATVTAAGTGGLSMSTTLVIQAEL